MKMGRVAVSFSFTSSDKRSTGHGIHRRWCFSPRLGGRHQWRRARSESPRPSSDVRILNSPSSLF